MTPQQLELMQKLMEMPLNLDPAAVRARFSDEVILGSVAMVEWSAAQDFTSWDPSPDTGSEKL